MSTRTNFVFRRHQRRLLSRLARLAVVVLVVMLGQFGPGSGTASAGFDCKDVPVPEFPRSALPSNFDASSADREPPTGSSPSGYQTYGWAGLKWYAYDLGCGPDIVRAPVAMKDTEIGNDFLTTGEILAATAFWLDEQTKTRTEAEKSGMTPALAQFDTIITSLTTGMFGFYSWLFGIALSVIAVVMLWNALKANAAAVTRSVAVAGAGLTLGAFFVGAPQKAIEWADSTFGSVITDTQTQMFAVSLDDSGGKLGGGVYDPRNVLMDKILLDDWRKGYFGRNYDDSQNQLGVKLRQSLAFSYAEQKAIAEAPLEFDPQVGFLDNQVQSALISQKERIFRDEIVKPLESHNLSYYTFQGKDSHRASIGFLAMMKLGLPSVLWMGASILKLGALLAIRFAILFAPVWVPVASVHGGWLSRVLRMLAAAYMWGVIGAVIVSLYLMALVKLYNINDGSVDGTWRLWFMVLLSIVCWMIMRPFKRISQILTQNNASVINRRARGYKRSLVSGLLTATTGMRLPQRDRDSGDRSDGAKRDPLGATGRHDAGANPSSSGQRPEGRGLAGQRNQDAREAQDRARVWVNAERTDRGTPQALTNGGRPSLYKANPDGGGGRAHDDVIDVKPVSTRDYPVAHNSDDQDREDELVGAGAAVSDRWHGGSASTIAPMQVYSSDRGGSGASPRTSMLAIEGPKPSGGGNRAPAPRIWDPSAGNGAQRHSGREARWDE
ncbi:hypothetical protein [Nocardia tengchongensis]|uniref:hypothetical protein n=1 Tax=Nocardia tengchongensis TaxID=2055889 RepID=UPI0036570E8E